MTAVGELEFRIQRRVIALFRDRLGYEYLGDWRDREATTGTSRPACLSGSSPVEVTLRSLIAKAIREVEKAAALGGGQNLYEANREAYRLLRYGARVKSWSPGEHCPRPST